MGGWPVTRRRTVHENEGTTHNRKILASCLTSFLCCAACLLGMASCQGNGGASDSYGTTYAVGGGGMSGSSASGYSAWDIKNLADEGDTDKIVELLTSGLGITDDSEAVTTNRVTFSASGIGLPAGGSVKIIMTVNGEATTYDGLVDGDYVHFDIPVVPSGSELTVVMEVYDGNGTLILSGKTSKTVTGTSDDLSLTLSDPKCAITFDTAGGSAIDPIEDIAPGSPAELPSPGPTKTNCVFMGWYADSGCTVPFDFSSVTESATAYAKWLPVGNTIAASTSPGNSLYDFVAPAGNTSNLLTLNGFQYTADLWGSASKFVNGTPGTTTTIYMDLQGTNKIIGGNHGGLKFRSSADDTVTSPGGHFEVIFTTSSSGTIELGFQAAGTGGCIQIQNVTANFSVASGCTVSEMKIGGTEYTDWNTFINDARANTSASAKASFRITRS